MPIKTYQLWKNRVLVIPLGFMRASFTLPKSISWGTDTVINSAQIFYTMKPGLAGVVCYLEVNNIEAAKEAWNFGDIGERSGAADIIGSLYNGENIFKFRGEKGAVGLLERKITISAYVAIDYTGKEPIIPFVVDWGKILLYGAAIVVSTTAVVVTVKSLPAAATAVKRIKEELR